MFGGRVLITKVFGSKDNRFSRLPNVTKMNVFSYFYERKAEVFFTEISGP